MKINAMGSNQSDDHGCFRLLQNLKKLSKLSPQHNSSRRKRIFKVLFIFFVFQASISIELSPPNRTEYMHEVTVGVGTVGYI